ncbi:MAG: hypothetical protein ACREV5_21585 [Steroidobacter sp.]
MQRRRQFLFAVASLVALGFLSACQVRPPERVGPAPALRLIDAAPLDLAASCDAHGSFVVDFTVEPSGRTAKIKPSAGPPCVQKALTAWVATFRYAPPGAEVPGSIEWLLVTAHRGS